MCARTLRARARVCVCVCVCVRACVYARARMCVPGHCMHTDLEDMAERRKPGNFVPRLKN